jgi:hypothetical protein
MDRIANSHTLQVCEQFDSSSSRAIKLVVSKSFTARDEATFSISRICFKRKSEMDHEAKGMVL